MFTKDQIKSIILEIKESVRRDVEPVVKAYQDKNNWIDGNVPGFWTIPRMIFPEIDGLGRLRFGRRSYSGSSKDAVNFMREYFPRKEYKKISGFLYNVFRHGLLHSHYPKEMIIYGRNRGWSVSLKLLGTRSMHFKFFSISEKKDLILDAEEFYKDFLSAIDGYIQDFDNPDKEAELIANFNVAYCEMRNSELEQESRKKSFLQDSDFDFFK